MNRESQITGRQSAKHTRRALLMAGGVLLAGAVTAAPAPAQCQYEVSAIISAPPCPFTGPPPLTGTGMNNAGAVVGHYDACIGSDVFGFYWSEDTGFITLPTPPGVIWVRPQDVNDAGLICGSMTMNGVNYLGFIYDINEHPGTYTFLPPLNGSSGASWANAINNSGVVAGARSIGKNSVSPYNAVIWDTATGEVTDLGVMNGPNSTAVDINAHNHVVGNSGNLATPGEEAFLWRNGKLTMLGPVPAGHSSHAHAVNDQQQVTANGIADQKKLPGILATAALWEDRSWIPIGVPDGCIGFAPAGLNSIAQVIGSCTVATNVTRPALWQHGAYVDLLDMIDNPPDVSLTTARSVNDAGNILARGNASGDVVMVLLAPIEVPLADLDINCRVDVHDLQWLLDQWMMRVQAGSDSLSADLNHDGVVNVVDLLILLSNWG